MVSGSADQSTQGDAGTPGIRTPVSSAGTTAASLEIPAGILATWGVLVGGHAPADPCRRAHPPLTCDSG